MSCYVKNVTVFLFLSCVNEDPPDPELRFKNQKKKKKNKKLVSLHRL